MASDTNRYFLTVTLLWFALSCLAQGPKEKVITNKACVKLGSNSVLLDELKSTEEEMTKYLKTKCPNNFFKTAIEFNLILVPKTIPCCKKMIIIDSGQISKAQTDSLLKYVVNFPGFTDLKIDQPKKLNLFIAFDQNFQPNCNFIQESGNK